MDKSEEIYLTLLEKGTNLESVVTSSTIAEMDKELAEKKTELCTRDTCQLWLGLFHSSYLC